MLDSFKTPPLDLRSRSAEGLELIELWQERNRLDALFQERLAEFDAGRRYAVDGSVTAAAWLRNWLRMRPAEASQRVKMARFSDSLPLTTQAAAAGEISLTHVAVIANAAAAIGIEQFSEHGCDRILSDLARQVDPHYMSEAVRKLRDFADPDGSLQEANHDFSRRTLSISPLLDGMHDVRGLLDAEGAATLNTALDALMRPDKELTPGQRRADALVELGRRQLQAGELPTVGGEKPQLLLMTSLPTLKKEPGAECSQLEWGGFIHRETARRIACDCALTPILQDQEGNIVGGGSRSRTIPPAKRKALYARDRSCRFPGCDRPASWCDGHHIEHWIDGGETELSNLVLLCRHHHRLFHEGGWRLVVEERRLYAIPPKAVYADTG